MLPKLTTLLAALTLSFAVTGCDDEEEVEVETPAGEAEVETETDTN